MSKQELTLHLTPLQSKILYHALAQFKDELDLEQAGELLNRDVTSEELVKIQDQASDLVRATRPTGAPLPTMTYEDWVEKYKPIQNPINQEASFDGTLFETYGDEVAQVANAEGYKTWTLMDDGHTILHGYHVVNRLGYFITEIAHTPDPRFPVLEVQVEEEDDGLADRLNEYCNDEVVVNVHLTDGHILPNVLIQDVEFPDLDQGFNGTAYIGGWGRFQLHEIRDVQPSEED